MSTDRIPAASSLDARLAALPKDIAPQRELWPGILAAIDAPRTRAAQPPWWRCVPLALAAGIAVAITAGLIGWQAGRVADPAGSRFAVPAGAGFLRTRAVLERSYRERLELLAPATRQRIEQDLTSIRAANQDIRRALAADPQSAVLNRLLESTWQQEFDLYATVVRNTEPAVSRSHT